MRRICVIPAKHALCAKSKMRPFNVEARVATDSRGHIPLKVHYLFMSQHVSPQKLCLPVERHMGEERKRFSLGC